MISALCVLVTGQLFVLRTKRSWCCAGLLIIFSCCAYLLADAPAAKSFVFVLADGTKVTGSLDGLSDGWAFQFGGKSSTDVLSLRRVETLLPARPLGAQVIFTQGDRLPLLVQKISGERVKVKALGSELSLPLSAISVIWLAAPNAEDFPDRFMRQLIAGRRNHDIVYLRNGDLLEGLLIGMERDGQLRLEVARKEVAVDVAKVAVVALNTGLSRTPRFKGPYAHIVLSDGGRLVLVAARADARTLTGKTLFGAEVAIPLEQLVALDIRQGQVVYLSDLKPARYESRPFLDLAWPPGADADVTGGDLRLAGQTYDKGLGLHAPCTVTYDLGGSYRRFEAVVGLADPGGRGGSAQVQILVDGQRREIAGDGRLDGRSKPLPMRVNVAGARELTLIVEADRLGGMRGRVCWAAARLVR